MVEMATAHIITVGLSVLDALTGDHLLSAGKDRKRKPFGTQAEIARKRGTLSIKKRAGEADVAYANECWGVTGNARQSGHAPGSPLEQLGRLLPAIDTDNEDTSPEEKKSHTYLASAELQGFWLGNRANNMDEGSLEIKEGDVVVFLVSDSQKGKMAAFWNAGLLANGDFSKVNWVNSSRTYFEGNLHSHPIHVVVVPELKSREDKIPVFARELGKFARGLSRFLELNSSDRSVVLHLSGGYKFALPYFLAMGEWIMSELRPSYPEARVRAFATHVDAPEFYVPLPLRRIPQNDNVYDVQEELSMVIQLAESETPEQVKIPDTDTLVGYAYEVSWRGPTNFTAHITTLGRGYAEFLRERPNRPLT